MKLQLQSCLIRPWLLSDAATLLRYANNRNIWMYLRDSFPHPYTADDAHSFLHRVMSEDPLTTLAIAMPSEAIGCIGLRIGMDIHRKTAELGYWLGGPFWGQGIMSEVVAGFAGYAFEAFDLQRIYAEPFENNAASVRVLDKAGFTWEGRMS